MQTNLSVFWFFFFTVVFSVAQVEAWPAALENSRSQPSVSEEQLRKRKAGKGGW